MKICQVCSHKFRSKIESAMLRGENLSALAREYNLTKDSMHNHKANHLPSGLAEVVMQSDLLQRFDLFNELEDMLKISKEVVQRNYNKDNDSLTIKALAESRGVIECLSKILQVFYQIKMSENELAKNNSSEQDEALLAEEHSKMLQVFTNSEMLMYSKLQNKLTTQIPDIIIADEEQFNFGKTKRRKSRIQR